MRLKILFLLIRLCVVIITFPLSKVPMKKRFIAALGAFVGSACAHAQSVDTFFDAKQLTQQGMQMAQSAASGTSSSINVLNAAQQKAGEYANQQGQEWLRNLFSYQRGTTEISGGGYQNSLPVWNILLVRPLTESEDLVHTTFVQGSVYRQGDRTTGNLGFGYRQLLAEKKLLLGSNLFYDWEFPVGNQRSSLGVEARSSVAELNANYYAGTTGWINTANAMQEKVLNGYDAELAIALPYMPAVQARAKTFRWMGIDGLNNTFGNSYSITGAVWKGLNIEVGHTTMASAYQPNVLLGASPIVGGNYFKISWTFGGDLSANQKQFEFKNVAYSLESMEDRRFEKVRRENRLVKAQRSQQGNGFNVTVSGF